MKHSLLGGVLSLLVMVACGSDLLPSTSQQLLEPDLTVVVNNNVAHQTMVGFGGDVGPWHISDLTWPERERLLQIAVQEMGLNAARMNLVYYEGTTAETMWGRNDNQDPFALDWAGFNFCTRPGEVCNDDWSRMLPIMRRMGLDGEYLGLIQGPRWNGFDGGSGFSVHEMVENQLAAFLHLRDRLGITVAWLAPFSEPAGGGIDWPISASDAVAVVRVLGARLEANGFQVKMIVPDGMTERQSLDYARAILRDPDARRYVGAIGYHTYGGRDGGENPPEEWIALRRELRELADSYGLPVRMTEYADLGTLMGRANHIFNELEHARSRTYQAQQFFATGDHDPTADVARERGGIVYYRADANGRLTEWGPTRHTGVAIRHYSRYATPGSVRVEAEGPDPRVRVQAFRDDRRGRLAVVAINNHDSPRRIDIELRGITVRQAVDGIQTEERTPGRYWSPITDIRIGEGTRVQLLAPARSLTSVALVR